MKKYLIILGYLIMAMLISIILTFLSFAVSGFSAIYYIFNFGFIADNFWEGMGDYGIGNAIILSLFINFIYGIILMVVIHKFIKNRSRKS